MSTTDTTDGKGRAARSAARARARAGRGEERAPGRPRSETANRAIIDAAMALIAEGESFANLSIEAIAARAGVGKATIYRRWPNVEALLLDTLGATKTPLPRPPGKSVREDILLCLTHMADAKRNPMAQLFNARVYSALAQEGQRNPDFVRRYRTEVIEPRREILRQILRRGVTNGELRSDLDIDAAHAMLTAPIILRTMSMLPGDKLPPKFVERLVETALDGMEPPKR
jgi:AcrR family transcriptional regulator